MYKTVLFSSLFVAGVACAHGAPTASPWADVGPRDGNMARTSARPMRGERLSSRRDTGAAPHTGTVHGPWLEHVRMQRWNQALVALEQLPRSELDQPKLRFIHGFVAHKLRQFEKARDLLSGLKQQLPELEPEIEETLALSELEVGPFAEAGNYFSSKGDPESWFKAAMAFERAGRLDKASGQLERLLKHNKLKPELEARARALRAEVLERLGQHTAAAWDLRWLSLHAPTSEVALGADEKLRKLKPALSLTSRERLKRAQVLAEAGQVDAVDREVILLKKARGPGVDESTVARTRGLARYRARQDYEEVAELFEQALARDRGEAARDMYYIARARSRANQDELALRDYGELLRRHPQSAWAQQAAYLKARLLYILGRWQAADQAYQRYLAGYARGGSYLDSARYERAVSQLAAGRHALAAAAFNQLGQRTKSAELRGRYLQLQGVAELGRGNKVAASQAFRTVIEEHPLSFPALLSASRLRQMGEKLPVPIHPPSPKAYTALKLKLTGRAALFGELGLDAQAEEALRLQEENLRKQYNPRGSEALCELYGRLSVAARRYRIGQRAAGWRNLQYAPAKSSSWLWDCLYPRPFEPLVREVEAEWRLPKDLMYAVMRQESGFLHDVVSPANAVGLMQLIPPTAKRVAAELSVPYSSQLLLDPPHNLRFAGYYLRKLLDVFVEQVPLAVASYNAGPQAVSRWLESGEELPLDVFVARIPYRETRGYVYHVMGNLARYAYADSGPEGLPSIDLQLPRGLRAAASAY